MHIPFQVYQEDPEGYQWPIVCSCGSFRTYPDNQPRINYVMHEKKMEINVLGILLVLIQLEQVHSVGSLSSWFCVSECQSRTCVFNVIRAGICAVPTAGAVATGEFNCY